MSIAFVAGRLLFMAAFFTVIWGYGHMLGRILRRFRPESKMGHLFLGAVFLISLLFMLGFAGGYNKGALWCVLAGGLVMAMAGLGELRQSMSMLLKGLINRWTLIMAAPLLLIIIRSLAPPYFIDACQYHYAICDEYLRAGGIINLEHFYFAQTFTTFFPETFYIIPLALFDDITANLVNPAFLLCCAATLHSILSRHGLARSFPFVCCLILGTRILFDTTVYAKSDIIVIFFLLHFLDSITRERPDFLKVGLALGFSVFCKLNLAVVAAPLLLVCLLTARRARSPHPLLLMCTGGLLPAALFLLKNLLTHGMLAYPFIADSTKVPSALTNGLLGFFKAGEASPLASRLGLALQETFFNNVLYAFHPDAFAWLLLPTLLCARRVRRRHLAWLVFPLLGWAHVACLSYIPGHAFRLSFPLWALTLLPLAHAHAHARRPWLRAGLLLLAVLSLLPLLHQRGRYLPGIKYHLGLQSLHEHYRINGPALGALSTDNTFKNLRPQGKIAVVSEYAHLLRHPATLIVNMSRHFDTAAIQSKAQFLDRMHKDDIEYWVVDDSLPGLSANIDRWLKQCLQDGDLYLVDKKYGHSLLRTKELMAPF